MWKCWDWKECSEAMKQAFDKLWLYDGQKYWEEVVIAHAPQKKN